MTTILDLITQNGEDSWVPGAKKKQSIASAQKQEDVVKKKTHSTQNTSPILVHVEKFSFLQTRFPP